MQKFAAGKFSLQGGSLNNDPNQPVTHPDIDFAGANFSVPWTAWEEDAGGVSQIFASRFLPTPDLSNGAWEINGALRGAAAGRRSTSTRPRARTSLACTAAPSRPAGPRPRG